MSDDELARIAAEADQLQAENENQPGSPGELVPIVDPVQEWRDAAHMGCGMVTAMIPELKSEWTPDKMDALGDALSKCADRYGWTVGEVLGHPLLALAVASWGLIAPMRRIEREKAEKAQQAKVVETVPQVVERQGNFVPVEVGAAA